MGACPSLKGQEKGGQSQATGSSDAPKKNRFDAFDSRGEQETSPDMVIGMWKVITIYTYVLLDPGVPCLFYTSCS